MTIICERKTNTKLPALHLLPRMATTKAVMSSLLVLVSLGAVESPYAQSPEGSEPSATASGKPPRKNQNNRSENGVEEIIITGAKLNLMDAQAIKRDADTMVDAISAQDIGVLSDRSSLDAMQRLPGVAIERFAAPDDPDHFGVEGSDIVLRGLSQTRSEFNGRDSFSAYSGRGLSYRDIPPELLGAIEVFKNQTADMVEGGIGGTVNLLTRKPFDANERVLAFSADLSYGDMIDEAKPTFSGLYGDVFETDVGKWGVLFNYVNSRLTGVSHGIQSDAYLETYAEDLVTEGDTEGPQGGYRAEDFLNEDGTGTVWVPSASNLLMKEDTREREGFAAALQFESSDGRFSALAEYIRSDSTLSWYERAIKYQGGFFNKESRVTAPLEGTHFVFDENGLFQAGTLVEQGNSWRLARTGLDRVPSGTGNGYPQWGHKTQMDSRVHQTSSLVEDFSVNATWQATEKLSLEFDSQYIQAKAAVDDLAVHLNTWAVFQYDVRGELPSLQIKGPWDDNVFDRTKFEEGGGAVELDEEVPYFSDEKSYFWRSAMDHYERSTGDSIANRLDLTYEVDRGALRSIKAGARFSRREQRVNATDWNWGALAPEWTGWTTSEWEKKEGIPENGVHEGKGIGWLDHVTALDDGYAYTDWSDFMDGDVVQIDGDKTYHVTESFIRSVMGANPQRYLYYSEIDDPSDTWWPYPASPNVDDKYGLFAPEHVNITLENRSAAYLRLDFGGDENLVYSGNIGLRYVKMEREAYGVVQFPLMANFDRFTQRFVPEGIDMPLTPEIVDQYIYQRIAEGEYDDYGAARADLDNNWARNPYNYLPNDVRAFAQGFVVLKENGEFADPEDDGRPTFLPYSEAQVAEDDYQTWLPSFNIKVEFTPELVGRFAFAKAIAFPDMADVRNRTDFASVKATTALDNDDIIVNYREIDVEDKPTVEMIESVRINRQEGQLDFVGEGGNPFMQPMESVQYDFSLEWYFSDYGQLSGAIFHKNLSNYFAPGVITRTFSRSDNGATQNVAVTSTRNGGDAKLDGFELNYHQFFSGWFEGFGIQATYTFIDANSVPNNEQSVEKEQWYDSVYEDTGLRVSPDKLPLQGQSDHTVNFIGMFENDLWEARLAYNWRSKYLLTTRDVISKAPQWYNAHGELDGSVFYNVTPNFKIGLQAENLTDERSETAMILNDDLLETGRSWFVADRRFSLVIKGEF